MRTGSGCGTNGRRVGQRGGCGAALCAPNIKQGCRRQPCSLSMLDSIYLIQFGFFGSRGLLGRKVLEWGLGRSPIYNGSRSGHGAKPHKNRPSCRGAGRPAPLCRFPCGARSPANTVPLRVKPQGGISYFFVFIKPRRGKTLRHISEASAAFSTSGRIYGTTQYVRALTNPAAALPFEYTSANQTVPTA